METKVRIMMATYNGEKYIREQIESIISQTYPNWSLIIQDDGSKDGTWAILEKYRDQDKRIFIRKSTEAKHGAYYNFHSIANQEKQSEDSFDYYMFCDQDDVWYGDKIEKMLSMISRVSDDRAVFGYADMKIMDENGSVISESICQTEGLQFINNISLFFSHIIYGCNTIMNKKAFLAVPQIDTFDESVRILSHDNLYAKFSGLFGEVVYLPDQLMSYRRHSNNVTSKHEYGYGLKRILKRTLGIDNLSKDHAHTYNQSLLAISLYRREYGNHKEVDEIEKILRCGGLKAINYVNKHKVKWGNPVKDYSHRLVMISKMYIKYLRY